MKSPAYTAIHLVLNEPVPTPTCKRKVERTNTRVLDYVKLRADRSAAYLERFREAVGAAQVVSSVAGTPLPDVYEFEVDGHPLVNQSLRQARIRECFGVTVVAVRKHYGELLVNPPADTVVNAGDKIRVFGLLEQIESFTPARNQKGTAI